MDSTTNTPHDKSQDYAGSTFYMAPILCSMGHQFKRLNKRQIFCSCCGEVRRIGKKEGAKGVEGVQWTYTS